MNDLLIELKKLSEQELRDIANLAKSPGFATLIFKLLSEHKQKILKNYIEILPRGGRTFEDVDYIDLGDKRGKHDLIGFLEVVSDKAVALLNKQKD